jgi:hypothetical protein
MRTSSRVSSLCGPQHHTVMLTLKLGMPMTCATAYSNLRFDFQLSIVKTW